MALKDSQLLTEEYPSEDQIRVKKIYSRYRNGNPIWNYFVRSKEEKSAVCNNCGLVIVNATRNTTNMRNHLKHKHAKVFQELLQICETSRFMYDSNNWKVLPFVPRQDFIKQVIENSHIYAESVDDEMPDFGTPCTPPHFDNDNIDRSQRFDGEVELKKKLLEAQIRKEIAIATFYEMQNKTFDEVMKSS